MKRQYRMVLTADGRTYVQAQNKFTGEWRYYGTDQRGLRLANHVIRMGLGEWAPTFFKS